MYFMAKVVKDKNQLKKFDSFVQPAVLLGVLRTYLDNSDIRVVLPSLNIQSHQFLVC
jgi:hypothetical protein